MSNTLRSWLAGLALALSVLIATAGADPRLLGEQILPFLLIVLIHAWMVVVAERVGSDRGGVEIKRFPLGPRLLRATPTLMFQFFAFVVLFGVTSGLWYVAGAAVVVVTVLSVDLLRGLLPYVLPALAAVYGLLTMNEFHTLGDLVDTAKGWLLSLIWIGMWAGLVSGTLLRTDVGPKLSAAGQLTAALAALPGYLLGFWVCTQSPLAGRWTPFETLALTLVAGGLVQTTLMTALSSTVNMAERLPTDIPDVSAHDVGLALLPLVLPVLAAMGLHWLPLGDPITGAILPGTWLGMLVVVLIIPCVFAAAMIGARLDRLDGRSTSRVAELIPAGALVAWIVAGPRAMQWLWGGDGLAARLAAVFPTEGAGSAVVAGTGEAVSLAGAALAGTLTLYDVPVTDLVRATTLMLLLCATLSCRLLRHASWSLRAPGWLHLALGLAVTAGLSWLALPRLGVVGMPLAVAGAATVMLLADLLRGTVERPEEDHRLEYESEEEGFDIAPARIAEALANVPVEHEPEPDYEIGFDTGTILEAPLAAEATEAEAPTPVLEARRDPTADLGFEDPAEGIDVSDLFDDDEFDFDDPSSLR